MKSDVFKVELDKFQNENIKNSTIMILEELPDYFYEVPASSSGKYHPAFSLGKGGLVRHVKACMRNLEEVFRDESFGSFDDYKKDLMRMALLLHDGFKSGYTDSGHTCYEHPLLMGNYILDNYERLSLTREDAIFVSILIKSHMGGPWDKNRERETVLPLPMSREQIIVHLCDYFASRNYMDIHFENNEIVDSANRNKTLTLS